MNITYLSTLNACLILILSMRTINAEQTFYCQPASGETYETLIEIHRLEKPPAWDSHSENPPLSARKALAIAEDFLKKEQPSPKGGQYVLDGLSLKPFGGHWFWLAEYEWQAAAGGSSGPGFWFQVGILMDGTVVTHKSAKSKK